MQITLCTVDLFSIIAKSALIFFIDSIFCSDILLKRTNSN